MKHLAETMHASERLAQRGASWADADLVMLFGTEVAGGFLLRAKDIRRLTEIPRDLEERLSRLAGTRIVVRDGALITAFRATTRQQRRLVRTAA